MDHMKMIALIILALLCSCGKVAKKSSKARQNPSPYFMADYLKVKVFYEPGAEPYTQENPLVPISYWNLLEENLKSLFKGRKKEPVISVPKMISEMTAMAALNDSSWTIEEVQKLSEKMNVKSDPFTFDVYFVNGKAAEDENIIGFHINATRTIVIFKEVIRSTQDGQLFEFVPKYVEQATLIHEIGHALGLVNNGVPMKEPHQDKAQGAHCSNPDCVMYYSNEGTTGLIRLAKQLRETGNTIMFDDKCLQDTRSF